MKNFLEIAPDRVLRELDAFVVIEDEYPVSPGHCLIVSRKLRKDFFDLTIYEQARLMVALDSVKTMLDDKYHPDGYNIGFNCGEAAGQSVMHFHCHVIPRYSGDMENPKGGVRYCIPDKGYYVSKQDESIEFQVLDDDDGGID